MVTPIRKRLNYAVKGPVEPKEGEWFHKLQKLIRRDDDIGFLAGLIDELIDHAEELEDE